MNQEPIADRIAGEMGHNPRDFSRFHLAITEAATTKPIYAPTVDGKMEVLLAMLIFSDKSWIFYYTPSRHFPGEVDWWFSSTAAKAVQQIDNVIQQVAMDQANEPATHEAVRVLDS